MAIHASAVTASEARQSMQSEVMDCRALACPEFIEGLSMNRLVIANAVKQSMTSEGMDRHGLRPRDDGAGSRSACGIGSDTAGAP
jgi:hypothetical protein